MFQKKRFGNFTSDVKGKPSLGRNVGKLFQPVGKMVADGIAKTAEGIGEMTVNMEKKAAAVSENVENVLKNNVFRPRPFRSSKQVSPSEKTEQELKFLKEALKTNDVFKNMRLFQLKELAGKFEKKAFKKNEIIVQQGETGDHFYILYGGRVVTEVDGEITGTSDDEAYYCFGEMSLLYQRRWSASFKADTDCLLFRIDYATFKRGMEEESRAFDDNYVALFKEVEGLKELDNATLGKLARAMTKQEYEKEEIIIDLDTEKAGHLRHSLPFMVVVSGKMAMSGGEMGGKKYEDCVLGPDQESLSFGWRAISAENAVRVRVTCTAITKTTVLSIEVETFREVVGDYKSLARRMMTRRQLAAIAVFRDSQLEENQLNSLAGLIQKRSFWVKTVLFKEGSKVEPAIYFVQKGTVTLVDQDGKNTIVETGGYFGDDHMLADQNKDTDAPPITKTYYAAVVSMDSVLDVLSLEDCRKVVNTSLLGLGKPTEVSALDRNIKPGDISRHTMLGTGSFGQVWLASCPNVQDKNNPRIYALKVQSKYQLISTHQAEGVVGECNIMASLKSPFIIRLFSTFHDRKCIYMLTSLLQGGEFTDVIGETGLHEVDAKFYAAGILEGLTYMHQKHIIHRDLKPQNVMINAKGYPVIIDLGFAKYVTDKTYTCCGSPMYMAPEVVNFMGHDKGADHWSWACMVYEMVTGDFAFYEDGMSEKKLFRKVNRGEITVYGWMSIEVKILLVSTLVPDSAQRLGSKPHGWFDLMGSPWFADVDFKELRRQSITAPWVPRLDNPLDASMFTSDNSRVQDKMTVDEPVLEESEHQVFKALGDTIETPKFRDSKNDHSSALIVEVIEEIE